MNDRKSILTSIGALICAVIVVQTATAGGDWNDEKIRWRPYEEGMAAAKTEKKPVCLIFYTEWCPHCTKYAKVFHDEKVVERSKEFVMVRLDKDKSAEMNKKYAPDGEYIPRTYFLSSQGELDPEIRAPRPDYQYFYDEANPAGILAGMEQALKKFR